MVTRYHVVSLIAKTMQMLIQPVNTLIMSYLTVKGSTLNKKVLTRFVFVAFAVGGLFFGACAVGTPIYVMLFYPSLYGELMQYNFVVNSGLILGFVASLFMAVLLSQGKTKLHTSIECVCGAVYVVSAYYCSLKYGMWGLAYVTLIMNTIKNVIAVSSLYLTLEE